MNKAILAPALALLCSAPLNGQLWSGIIAPSRATDWTQAGVKGDIPSRTWTQCGATIAAYSGTAATINGAVNHTASGYTGCGANTYVQLGAGTFNLSTGIPQDGVLNQLTDQIQEFTDQTQKLAAKQKPKQGKPGRAGKIEKALKQRMRVTAHKVTCEEALARNIELRRQQALTKRSSRKSMGNEYSGRSR
jgi:hypothetical protein